MSEQGLVETEPSVMDEPVQQRDRPSRLQRWIAPAWFLLGMLVGVVGFAAYTRLNAELDLDKAAVREAARDGTLDAIATLQAGGSSSSSTAPNAPTVAQASSFTIREANRIGDPNASVTIFEFSDFQCPFCGRFFRTVEAALFRDYVDTGKVTFVYKHFAFLGQESVWAAVASECAADQGRFWEYHDLLFNRQAGENVGAFSKDRLMNFAKQLGLDMAQFEPCLKEERTLDRVQADAQEGRQANVTGTPTFFINGQPLAGAQPFETFQAVIDPLLNGQ